MKLPAAFYIAGSVWLFASILSEYNRVHIENASSGVKCFNLFMLVFAGKLLYKSIDFLST